MAKEIEAKIYEAVGIQRAAARSPRSRLRGGRRDAGGAGRLTSADEELRRAFDLAGRALSVRDRSVAELRTYLEGKRVEPDLIDQVIAALEAPRSSTTRDTPSASPKTTGP